MGDSPDATVEQRRVPAAAYVCINDNSTNIRSGPGTDYPVLTRITVDTLVKATFFRLTEPQSVDTDGLWIGGEGWFEVDLGNQLGWVSSTRIATDCDLWRSYSGYGASAL